MCGSRRLTQALAVMNWKGFIAHVLICLVVGALIAYFSHAKWLAAALWVSAALFINGSLAYYEDALPGGFDNPHGSHTSPITHGLGALRYWVVSLGVSAGLAVAGLFVQVYL